MKNNDIKPNFLKIKELGFDTKINWNLSPERLEDICLSKGIAKKTNLGAKLLLEQLLLLLLDYYFCCCLSC